MSDDPQKKTVVTAVPISADLVRALAEAEEQMERFRREAERHMAEDIDTLMLGTSVRD